MTSTFASLHIPIADESTLIETLSALNIELHSAGMYFQLDTPDSIGYTSYPELPEACVMVLASFDFTYYHQIEFCFHGVVQHTITHEGSWADHWQKPQLVLLSDEERALVLQRLHLAPDIPQHVFAFNIGSFTDDQYYIVADALSMATGTVFHYNRSAQEALMPGERIAWWVSR